MWRTIGIPFEGNGGHGDGWAECKPLFQLVVLWFALCQAEPPAVIVDDDRDMVRIVERCRRAIEGSSIELPLWRSKLPNELGKVVPIFLVLSSGTLQSSG